MVYLVEYINYKKKEMIMKTEKRQQNIDKLKEWYSYLTYSCGMEFDYDLDYLIWVIGDKDLAKLIKKLDKPNFRYRNSWEYEEGMKVVFFDFIEDHLEEELEDRWGEYENYIIQKGRDEKLDLLGL